MKHGLFIAYLCFVAIILSIIGTALGMLLVGELN